jgi:hypothetical protein
MVDQTVYPRRIFAAFRPPSTTPPQVNRNIDVDRITGAVLDTCNHVDLRWRPPVYQRPQVYQQEGVPLPAAVAATPQATPVVW